MCVYMGAKKCQLLNLTFLVEIKKKLQNVES